MQIKLEFLQGPLAGQSFCFDQHNKISIGRDQSNYFPFTQDKLISRFHCIMEVSPPNRCYILDLGSRNGTFWGKHTPGKIAYQKITEKILNNHDRVWVGESVFAVSWKENAIETINTSEVKKDSGSEFAPGDQIGDFVVLRTLGKGGMGEVYLMQHPKYQYLYAFKIARPQEKPDEIAIKRFEREAASGSSVKHKNVIRHYGITYNSNDNYFYIVMEYVEGIDLGKYQKERRGPLSLEEVKYFTLQLLDALECLHHHKIVHRDIKPSNMMLKKEQGGWCLKLGDFGLAKNFEEAGFSGITKSFSSMGTPQYMAPEQWNNARNVDPRADIYSVGITMYKMLTDHLPYEKVTQSELLCQIFTKRPTPIRQINAAIPEEIENIINQCLLKNKENRVQTVSQLRSLVLKSF